LIFKVHNEFFSNRLAVAGVVLAAFLLLFITILPLASQHEPNVQNPARKLRGPDSENLLGTDQFGRDVLTRVAFGGRRSLGAAVAVVGLTLGFSVFAGIAIAMVGGILDSLVSRIIDVVLAVPSVILALAIVGVLGVGYMNLLIAVVFSFSAFYTRLARGYAFSASQRPDVTTARLAGLGWMRITGTHIAPDVFKKILIVATLDLGGVIVAIASLSFLGLGAQPPDAEWGAMLGEARFFFTTAPHLLLVPSVAILLTIVSVNLIGNGLRRFE
jgi:peptide/nickel transport system permease protein